MVILHLIFSLLNIIHLWTLQCGKIHSIAMPSHIVFHIIKTLCCIILDRIETYHCHQINIASYDLLHKSHDAPIPYPTMPHLFSISLVRRQDIISTIISTNGVAQYQLNNWEHISVEFESNYASFNARINLKMLSAKRWPFCLGINMITRYIFTI